MVGVAYLDKLFLTASVKFVVVVLQPPNTSSQQTYQTLSIAVLQHIRLASSTHLQYIPTKFSKALGEMTPAQNLRGLAAAMVRQTAGSATDWRHHQLIGTQCRT